MSTTALEVKVTVEQSIALANSSSPIAQDDKDKKDKIAGLDLVGKLQILLVFPKNSQEYKLIYQGFLKIRVFKETESFVKNSLVMLLNHKGSLTLPLKQEKLNKLPNLLDKETDTFQYDYCIKLLQDLAEKKKLVPLVVANLQSLLEKQQEFSNSLILTLVTILLKNCYVSLSIEDKNKIKVAIKNFLSQMDAEPIEIPKDLIPLLRCLRQFLHHFNQELRLEARSITEALRIPLEIHDMLSLSIDGMQHGREKAEDLVLVVGASGSGKSTLINCLGGVEHYFVKDPATDKPYLRHKLGQKILVKVGHSSTSETLYPLVVQSPVTFKRTKSVKLEAEEIATEVETDLTEGEADTFDMGSELKEITELFAYADTPGFDDNRDEEEATCAALGVPLATHYAKKIRALVVVVPWIMTEPNSREHVNAFRLLCQTVDGILKDSKALLKDKDDKSPVPLIFAISKPPRPERGECFDAEKLRTKLENRIKEIKFDREKKYADLKNQEENKCVLEQNIVNLELCLNELPGFNSVDKMGLSFLARFSKRITEGERALAIKEQSQKWKASGIPQECVEKLELVLRKSIIAVAENSSDSEVIENFRQEWEREKNRFKGEFDKLSKSMEEIMSEKTMLDLMTQRSDNVFFIRGYQDSEEDTPDHREEFLNYLKWLREEEIYITEENFEFDATSEKFKRVTDWASNFASKMNEMLVGLLELPDRIDKNDAVIQSIKNDIEKKKTLLKAELTATEQEVEHEIQKTIRAWELERLHTAKDIKTLEEENDKIVAKIRAIDESPAIEYRSRLFKSTWFASHIRFYEFPGRQPKRTPANANRGWWNRLRGHYPDGHDIIPIERVELSCTVDKQSRLVFKTSISKDNTQFQGCTILSDSSIDLVPHSLNPDIVEIYPKKGSDLTKNGYFQYDPQNDLSQGQFSVKYYLHFGRMQRQDQYGIRIFVLLKNIPTYRYEKERLQAEMNRKEREIQERIEDQKRLEKDIKVFEEYLSLMKRGFNDQKNKMSTIQSLIQELDYSKGEFLKLFGGVASHIVWLVKPGNYEMLSRFLNCTEEQARKLGLERKWLAACIVGEDQERTSSKKLNDIEFQENLMEVPENFFKDMYPVLKTTGLTLNSLATIVGYLDSPTLATSALATPTLSKKLEIQELKKAGNQYLFESLRALYLSHDLRVRTLDQVISLLRFDNDRDIKNYLTASTAVKAKNIIGRCYSAIDKNVLKEVINSLFDTSVGLDAWVDCHRYGIKMDYLRSISGRAKPDDDSQNSVTRHLIEIYTKLYEAVKQGNKNACLDLLSGFFALDTNALPMTFNPDKVKEPLLFTLAQFDRVSWLENQEMRQFLRLDITDQQKNTALHHAASCGQSAFGEMLIQKGILATHSKGQYIWPKNKLGQTPFHVAALRGKVDLIIKWVEKYEAQNELLCSTNSGDSIIHLLVRHRQTEALVALMKKYPYLPVHHLNIYKQDPVYLAVTNKDEKTVFQLLEYSVDLANRDVNGRTALHEAVRLDLLTIVQKLLEKGADLRMTDNGGATPDTYAPYNSKIYNYLSNLKLEKRSIAHFKVEVPTWRNLVFQGGGVKGFVYSIALRTLIEESLCDPDLSQFERVAGTSAGAITALLVGLGYNVEEIDHIVGVKTLIGSDLPQVKFKDLLDGDWGSKLIAAKNQDWKELLGKEHHAVLERIKGIDGVLVGIARVLDGTAYQAVQSATSVYQEVKRAYQELNQDFGLCPGEKLLNLFKKLICIKLLAKTQDNTKDFTKITFEELSHYDGFGFKDMYFVGVNTATGEPEVFSKETTPDMVIANAVRISMSIPGVFKPCHKLIKKNGKLQESEALYVDGGLLWNYPIDIFDFEKYVDPKASEPKLPRINKETLGVRLVSTKRQAYYEQDMKLEEENITTLWQHIQSLATTLVESEERNHARQGNQFRTIYIDPLSVGTLDFEKVDEIIIKKALIEQGRQGVLTFKNRMQLLDYSKITLPGELLSISSKYQTGKLKVKGKSVQLTDMKFNPHPELVVAFYSYPDCRIQSLLHQNFGVSLWSRDEDGNTAFHVAAKSNQTQVLERLLKVAPSGVLTKNFKGETPACLTTDKEVLVLLEQYSTVACDSNDVSNASSGTQNETSDSSTTTSSDYGKELAIFFTGSLSSISHASSSSRPEINIEYQYEDNDIQAILCARLQQLQIKKTNRIEPLAAVDNISDCQLETRLKEEKSNNQGARTVLIPCNLGNAHWAGILLEFQANGQVNRVIYIDSYARNSTLKIPEKFQAQLHKVYPTVSVKTSPLLQQDDGTSCGAYTIENLLIAAGLVNISSLVASPEITRTIRKLHLEALKQYNSSFYTAFNQRQRNNHPTTASLHAQLGYLDRLKEISFSKQELNRILAIKNCLYNLPQEAQIPLVEAFKNNAKHDHGAHLEKIRSTLQKASQVESKAFVELIQVLFNIHWQPGTPLVLDKKCQVSYEEILAVTKTELPPEQITSLQQNLAKQIKEDEEFARKLQAEFWDYCPEVSFHMPNNVEQFQVGASNEQIDTGSIAFVAPLVYLQTSHANAGSQTSTASTEEKRPRGVLRERPKPVFQKK